MLPITRTSPLILTVSCLLFAAAAGASSSQFPNNLVSGVITFQGAPVAGVTVTAFNTNTNTFTQVVTSDQNGNYQLQLPAWINTAPR